jgi:hypothetical protein
LQRKKLKKTIRIKPPLFKNGWFFLNSSRRAVFVIEKRKENPGKLKNQFPIADHQ